MTTACLYEEFDVQLHVQTAVQIFKKDKTVYYTRLRAVLEGTEESPPPRVCNVPEGLLQRITHLREVTRHKLGCYIIKDQDAGLTNCSYGVKVAIDLQGESVTIDKNLKRVGEAVSRGVEDSSEIATVTKNPRRERQSGG